MKLKLLNRGARDNRYCGPAVLSFVTGLNTADAALLLRRRSGRNAIRGTSKRMIADAFSVCGYGMVSLVHHPRPTGRPTLAGWLKASVKDRTPGRVFLIDAGNHWQLVTGRRYACGRIGEIVSIKHERVKRRARVEDVWELFELTGSARALQKVQDRIDEWKCEAAKNAASCRKETRERSVARHHAQVLAQQYGIEIDVDYYDADNQSIYIDPPEWVVDAREAGLMPQNGISVAYDWEEAEQEVRRLVAEMREARPTLGLPEV